MLTNLFDFHIFSFLLVYTHDFVTYIDFTRTAASNSDWRRHRL